jgi:hypothetical protein
MPCSMLSSERQESLLGAQTRAPTPNPSLQAGRGVIWSVRYFADAGAFGRSGVYCALAIFQRPPWRTARKPTRIATARGG